MARILVIDDDPAVGQTIQVILEHEGHEVTCACDGDRGLGLMTSMAPQLIITDIIMPNREGLATIMDIRARGATVPILAMSGGGRIGNADFLKMAVRLGANEVIAKPFERRELIAVVDRLLTMSASPQSP